jgi:pimeloyl-ACP methyl ester carboxylesterase
MSSSVACRLLDRSAAIVLIEGNIIPPHLQISDRIVQMSREAYEDEFGRLGARAEMVLKWETRLRTAEDRRYFAGSYRRCRVGAAWTAAHAVNQDVRADGVLRALRSSSRPLCVLYGSSSSFAGTVSQLRGALPRATFVEIADASHFTMLDQPEAVYKAIGDFVQGVLLRC